MHAVIPHASRRFSMVSPLRSVRLVTVLLPIILAGALASPASSALGRQLVPSSAGIQILAKGVHGKSQFAPTQPTVGLSTFPLSVNPGLGTGKTFACPAIQHATASIAITNRFALHQLV